MARHHLSGSVPVSIGVHLVVLLVFVVIPLVDIVMPVPAVTVPPYVLAEALPLPPSGAPRPVPSAPAARLSPGLSIAAPDAIRPEAPVPSSTSFAVDTGLPPGFAGSEVGGISPVAPPAAPDAPKPQPGPVRVAQLPEAPRKTVDVRPSYPEVARIARVEGTVVLEAVVDTSGRVTDLRVLRSVPLLDEAALEAVRQWRYTPSTYAGRRVSVLMTVTVRFTLQQ